MLATSVISDFRIRVFDTIFSGVKSPVLQPAKHHNPHQRGHGYAANEFAGKGDGGERQQQAPCGQGGGGYGDLWPQGGEHQCANG